MLDAALKACPESSRRSPLYLVLWASFITFQRSTSLVPLNAAGDKTRGIACHQSSRRYIAIDNRSECDGNHISQISHNDRASSDPTLFSNGGAIEAPSHIRQISIFVRKCWREPLTT